MQDVEAVYARRLKETREAVPLSQAALAARLAKEAGIELDPTAITRIERGQRGIALREAYALARVIGVPLEYLCRPYPLRRIDELEIELAQVNAEYDRARSVAESAGQNLSDIGRRMRMLEAELAEAQAAEQWEAADVARRSEGVDT